MLFRSEADNLLVYLKDLNFDSEGRPIILFLTSKGFESGPKNNPREWKTAHWNGKQWILHTMTESDNNYDHGSLFVEADGTWRVIAPTESGPQAYNTGGEMVMWVSSNRGETWSKQRELTRNSRFNHSYARRPTDAHPDFYALWADGHGREVSESSLYFANQTGTRVWRLPAHMKEQFARPEEVPLAP